MSKCLRKQSTVALLVASAGCLGAQGQALSLMSYSGGNQAIEERPPALKAGDFSLYPAVSFFAFVESPISRQVSDTDIVLALAPSLTIRYPELATPQSGFELNYTPIYNRYLLNPSFSTLDHSATFSAAKSFPRIDALLRHTFKKETDIYFEDGERTEELSFNTYVDVVYPISEKLKYTLTPSHSRRDYERGNLFGITTWALANNLDYELSPKTTIGAIITPGIRELHEVDSSTFERVQAKISYFPSPKLTLAASAGATFWQTSNRGTEAHPILSLAGSYTFSEKTSFQLGITRLDDLSAVRTNQSHITTQFATQLRYNFSQKLSSTVSLGYRITEYFVTGPSTSAAGGETTGITSGLSFDYALNEHWSGAVFWRYWNNELTVVNDSFTRNRVGISITYKF